jgi:hypothetical protein
MGGEDRGDKHKSAATSIIAGSTAISIQSRFKREKFNQWQATLETM